MRYVCLVLLVTVLPGSVISFGLIREFLFPRNLRLNRVRSFNTARLITEPTVLDFVGLVEKYGYTGEQHNLTTVDGYNIVLHRISGAPGSPKRSGKPAVFLQHGILISSDSWVLIGPHHDLAFLLANEGYDVWVGNTRGNSYCRSHRELSPSNREFWKFSFHEMAVYDLPTMIDYALNVSGQKSLHYIGHSMGTTMSYVLLSEKPEYNTKIRLLISMAPVAFWKVPPGQLLYKFIEKNSELLQTIFRVNNIQELFPQTSNNARLAKALCSDESLTQPACIAFIFSLAGNNPNQLNTTIIPYWMSYYPSGTSLQTLVHYLQNIRQGAFQSYDYGYVENFKIYGQKRPPLYDLKKITAPVALIYSRNDPFVQEENLLELSRKLKNLALLYEVPDKMFNHLDYLWAKDVKTLLNSKVIELLALHV